MTTQRTAGAAGPRLRLSRWLEWWGPILPLLAAEFILLAGFGAVLPVLPLYITEQGVDLPTLGLVVAAWPAARLVCEPIFGWLADRTARRPLMITGLLLSALFVVAPLFVVGPVAFTVLRALAGAASAMYDPAARGYLMDATPAERRGEAFGLYSAAQNAGFILGPAIGGVAAALSGDVRAVFIVGGLGILIAAVVVAIAVHEQPRSRAARDEAGTDAPTATPALAQPHSLWNRAFLAAIVLNFGNFFAGGVWEVIWSLYMVARGGDLAWIGLTFALFGVPILIVSPLVGRLVDRRGAMLFVGLGTALAVTTSLLYIVVRDLPTISTIVIFEGLGWVLVAPALYAIVGRGKPDRPLVHGTGRVRVRHARLHHRLGSCGPAVRAQPGLAVRADRRRRVDHVRDRRGHRRLGCAQGHRARGTGAGRPRTRMTSSDWRDHVETVDPTVLVMGGFLMSPPFYRPFRTRLLRRGVADVVVDRIWTPDWLLAEPFGLGRILGKAERGVRRAALVSTRRPRSRGAPLLVIGHSTGGILARLLARERPLAGDRFGTAGAIGAIVTLGSPHRMDLDGRVGRTSVARAARLANRSVPGASLAPEVGYVSVGSRAIAGRPDGVGRERVADAVYRAFIPSLGPAPIDGDGLVPLASTLLDGARQVVLDDVVHGQGGGQPWYGTDHAIERWWPVALEVWREALRARATDTAG